MSRPWLRNGDHSNCRRRLRSSAGVERDAAGVRALKLASAPAESRPSAKWRPGGSTWCSWMSTCRARVGFSACRELRRIAPCLCRVLHMLTVRDSEARARRKLWTPGQTTTSPSLFPSPERVARLRSAVRRAAIRRRAMGERRLSSAKSNWILPADSCGEPGLLLRLTPKEFDLLHYFGEPPRAARAARRSCSRWCGVPVMARNSSICGTFVHQLRRKLEQDPASPEYLLTEHHFGYRFKESAAAAS